MLPITAANAYVVDHFFKYEPGEGPIPCSRDWVVLGGYVHILITVTEDSSGGWHMTFHAQPTGVTGEVVAGPNTGTKCHAVGVTRFSEYHEIFEFIN